MKPPAVRLLVVSLLFAAWLGYLGWQVLERPRTKSGWPLVVSRAQILTSDIDVIAEIDDPSKPIKVVEVLHAGDTKLTPGTAIKVEGLEACRPVGRGQQEAPKDFSGPGLYLVPLKKIDAARNLYEVAPIPPSPGFRAGDGICRIYPDVPQTRAQYRQIKNGEED